MKLTPQQFAYAKSQLPGASDQDIIAGFEQSDVTPDKIDTVLQALKAQSQAPTQSVTVQGQAPQTDQKIAAMPGPQGQAPQATTNQLDTLYQGKGPTAKRLNTSDPDLYNSAAEKEYNAKGGNSDLLRATSGLVAATASGLGGQAGAYEANRKRWDDMETARNTGRVKEAQALADKGLTGANAALGQTVSAKVAQDKLEMDKKAFILDMQSKGLAYEQAAKQWDEVGVKLYDPNGPMAKISRDLAAKALGVDSKSLDGMSPAELVGIIQHSKPTTELQNQAQTQLQNIFNGVTSRIGAVAGARQANAGAAATELGTNIVSNATGGGTQVPQGMNLTIGAGPAALAPSPAVTGQQSGAAEQVVNQRKRITDYSTSGAGTAVETILNRLPKAGLLSTGTLSTHLAKLSPTEAASVKSGLANYYASQGMKPEDAARQAEVVLGSKPSDAIRTIAQIKASQLGSKAILQAQEEYLTKNGSLNGFVEPKIGRFYNPATGKVVITDDPKDTEKLKKSGFMPITQ